jgi:hypothetical protein
MTTTNNSSISNEPIKSPFLRTSRDFPEELKQLCIEVNKAYIDIANNVNARTIGAFPSNRSITTGETWYIYRNQKQTGIRQVYPFTSTSPITIPHGINVALISAFIRIFGTATDGTNWYPLPYVDVVDATNQINVIVTPTDIEITAGAGAPAITSGTIVLEWLANT